MSSATQVYPPLGSNNPNVELVFAKVLYDGSGVPSVSAGRGFTSCSDDGTGLFTLTTAFPWNALVGGGALMMVASAAGQAPQVAAHSPSARTIQIRVVGSTNLDSAEDPANGDGVLLMFALQRDGTAVK